MQHLQNWWTYGGKTWWRYTTCFNSTMDLFAHHHAQLKCLLSAYRVDGGDCMMWIRTLAKRACAISSVPTHGAVTITRFVAITFGSGCPMCSMHTITGRVGCFTYSADLHEHVIHGVWAVVYGCRDFGGWCFLFKHRLSQCSGALSLCYWCNSCMLESVIKIRAVL